MIKNNKGFSMVELLAMIIITSVIIFPLMHSLVKNVEINERLHLRQSATSIASTSLYGVEKLDYTLLYGLVNAANIADNYYIELNADNCNSLIAGSTDEALCVQIFNLVSSNFTAGSDEYRVFIYNFNLPQTYYDELTDPLNTSIPLEVKNEISLLTPSLLLNPTPNTLLRVTVWIKYFNEPPYYVVLSGLIFDEENLK